MRDRAELERRIEAALAPHAARASESRGRVHREDEPPYRGLFQRDRDRLIHCTAFRRLEYKTQVFVVGVEGDHFRTRLTHTLEVSQIARTAARALALNEDLVEAIALAHDLGHGPFGHSGETALHEVMAPFGGFDHNLQGLRIVDRLERRYAEFAGLNLTYETREGFTKNLARGVSGPEARGAYGFAAEESPALETQVVGHADEIAYDTHDVEDGLVAGVLREEDLRTVALWRETEEQVRAERPAMAADPRLRLRAVVRRLIGRLVSDLIAETERRLAARGVRSMANVRACPEELVGFSTTLGAQKDDLETYLHQNFYYNPRVRQHTALWQSRIPQLFQVYRSDPRRMPEGHLLRVETEGEKLERVICDYIAGMTDRYAEEQWKRCGGEDSQCHPPR
jgi:dGTPase